MLRGCERWQTYPGRKSDTLVLELSLKTFPIASRTVSKSSPPSPQPSAGRAIERMPSLSISTATAAKPDWISVRLLGFRRWSFVGKLEKQRCQGKTKMSGTVSAAWGILELPILTFWYLTPFLVSKTSQDFVSSVPFVASKTSASDKN